jgi:hypothetical protein
VKLPNPANARVAREKVEEYLLSTAHPVGSAKARYFASRGYQADAPEVLETDLLRIAHEGSVRSTQATPWGTKYLVVGRVPAPDGGPIELATVWMLQEGAGPVLVTAYPWRG